MSTASKIRGLEQYAKADRAKRTAAKAKAERHEFDRIVHGSNGCVWARCCCGWSSPLFVRADLAQISHNEHRNVT
jgi:hypothetical protein